ncbi:MAG: heme-binding protein [Crocinitomicaceae bacterium]|nr:heme-binding protein [Crocinitomicaceae bacterium]MBP6032729.1 heme-binding protein [Crocinitomicaceae bacterium]
MKKMMYVLIGIFSVLIIIVIVMSFRYSNIEMPKYTVLKSYEKNIELRQYPNMIVAKTSVKDKSFENSGSDGFRSIAGYIFGGNEKEQKIAMTSPVVMELNDSATMYFVMPSQYKKDELPNPSNKKVTIQEEVSKVLLVVRYGGYSNDERIESHITVLKNIIQKHNLKATGGFMYMGYNAPWDIINRRNEVAIEITP